jgi:hypothetical protein
MIMKIEFANQVRQEVEGKKVSQAWIFLQYKGRPGTWLGTICFIPISLHGCDQNSKLSQGRVPASLGKVRWQ